LFLENCGFLLFLHFAGAGGGRVFLCPASNVVGGRGIVQSGSTNCGDEDRRSKKLEDQVNITRRQLGDFSGVISARTSARDFFARLESLIVPGVYLSSMNADFPKMSASFSGHGKNFPEVERQAMKFRSSPEILKSANLDKISVNEAGGVDFSAVAVFNSEIKKRMIRLSIFGFQLFELK